MVSHPKKCILQRSNEVSVSREHPIENKRKHFLVGVSISLVPEKILPKQPLKIDPKIIIARSQKKLLLMLFSSFWQFFRFPRIYLAYSLYLNPRLNTCRKISKFVKNTHSHSYLTFSNVTLKCSQKRMNEPHFRHDLYISLYKNSDHSFFIYFCTFLALKSTEARCFSRRTRNNTLQIGLVNKRKPIRNVLIGLCSVILSKIVVYECR